MGTRREFLIQASVFGSVFSLGRVGRAFAQDAPLPPKSPAGIATTAMHYHLSQNGGDNPLRKDPVAYIDYCRSLGAGGIQHAISSKTIDLKRVRQRLDALGMYYEGQARLPRHRDDDLDDFTRSIEDAVTLGATCVRAVSPMPPGSDSRRYDTFTSREQFKAWHDESTAVLEKCLPIAERLKVAIALENHKDRRVDDHVAVIRKFSSEYLGALIDPGNNMSFMEEPIETVTKLAPYAKACSLKDMGVAPYEQGFLLSEVRFGEGMSDQKKLFDIMRQHNPKIFPTTELITRDPLKVPVLTDDYYRSFSPDMRAKTKGWMQFVKAHASKLPVLSTQTPQQQLAAEESNNRQVLDWARQHLT